MQWVRREFRGNYRDEKEKRWGCGGTTQIEKLKKKKKKKKKKFLEDLIA